MTQFPAFTDGLAYVLLIGTSPSFNQKISADLAKVGYQTIAVEDPEQGFQRIQQTSPSMLVVDYNVLGKKGIEFCRMLRSDNRVFPILFLVTQDRVEERVVCLEAGADDYLLQPYQREKLNQVLSVYLQPQPEQREQLLFGDLVLDLNSRQVWRSPTSIDAESEDDQTPEIIDLTVKEFELLKYLMSYPQQVLTREQILKNVWGEDFQGESNVIEVYIRYLRLKVETKGHKRLIQTVRGVGYVLKDG
ncbi:two component transcriptional regulator, winged helix family [[Leptolyngbya] sp. PCC 7376]|uniref:response regulator transcription factor n=1 Tax=[Leptolyngbya] sp. PCC 7376 TaxID=111781 RepID=UPI00029ED0E3|nr:response regulator transcription factor [[Leptolyngbya] sp. PCC 7376]AFY36855.1 two component transcriptional regulator, winged helix family [[Leptolyngbya] sp. PCC 7376]